MANGSPPPRPQTGSDPPAHEQQRCRFRDRIEWLNGAAPAAIHRLNSVDVRRQEERRPEAVESVLGKGRVHDGDMR